MGKREGDCVGLLLGDLDGIEFISKEISPVVMEKGWDCSRRSAMDWLLIGSRKMSPTTMVKGPRRRNES